LPVQDLQKPEVRPDKPHSGPVAPGPAPVDARNQPLARAPVVSSILVKQEAKPPPEKMMKLM